MDSDSPHPPKLMFADENGQYYLEHLPRKPWFWEHRLETYLNVRRIKKGKGIYYWHLKTIIPQKELKMLDLNFILHFINDHKDNPPEDQEETKHFNLIYPQYKKEFEFFLIEKNKKWRKHKHAKNLHLQKDPYYIAYKKHWIDTFDYSPNIKVLYHGGGKPEVLGLFDAIIQKAKEVDTEKAKSIGLSLEQFYALSESPKPEFIKQTQKEVDYSNIDTKLGLKIAYWAADLFLTFAMVVAFNVEPEFDSLFQRIWQTLLVIMVIQILFIVPYFLGKGAFWLKDKLAKWIKSKFYKSKSDSEPQPEE